MIKIALIVSLIFNLLALASIYGLFKLDLIDAQQGYSYGCYLALQNTYQHQMNRRLTPPELSKIGHYCDQEASKWEPVSNGNEGNIL